VSSSKSDPLHPPASDSGTKTGPLTVLNKVAAVFLALSGIGLILWFDNHFLNQVDMPKLSRDMSYGLLFFVGFLTGFHCVGMCGPLVVGYTAKYASSGTQSYGSHLLYGLGKTVSYTLIGGLFGAFGSIFAFTPYTQGMVGIAAGVFLILFGLHTLNVFPALRHFHVKTPGFLMRFVGKEYRKHHNPFTIGLLNGLMIMCGPLQAIYIMAAGAGSWSEGAAILFFFGLGTLPLLLGFGFLTSLVSANLTPKILRASGIVVVILGSIMLNRGLAVAGSGFDFNTLMARVSLELSPTEVVAESGTAQQTITMDVLSGKFVPNRFTLRKGVPVKWMINGKELNECNRVIVVPQYGLEIKLHEGTQVIEFTPEETGVVPWSCWMGMIPGTFIVVDNTEAPSAATPAPKISDRFKAIAEDWRNHLIRKAKELGNRLGSLRVHAPQPAESWDERNND
jgi:sulfite exporter TauE/SafE